MLISSGVISEGVVAGAVALTNYSEYEFEELLSLTDETLQPDMELSVDFSLTDESKFYDDIVEDLLTFTVESENALMTASEISVDLLITDEVETHDNDCEDTLTFTAESEDTRFNAAEEVFALSSAMVETRESFALDALVLTDSAVAVTTQLVEEGLTLSDDQSEQVFQSVLDVLIFTDEGESLSRGSALLQETLTLSEVTVGRSGVIDEVEALATFSDAQDDASSDFVDAAATFSAQIEQSGVQSEDVLDTVAFVTDAEAVSISQDAFEDALTFSDATFYKDPSATAWVMNTETAAPYWYSNWQFSDMIQVGDKVLAVGPEGLCVIGANTDAGETIEAAVQYGFTDFGAEQKKRVPEFVFGYTAETPMGITVETYGQGYPPYEYQISAQRLSEQPNNGRLTPGKGLNARYWRIAVRNTDGGAFSVNSITASLAVSSRRL